MRNVPKLRFKEFSGEWEEKKLETIIKKYEDPIETPTEGYMRLGLRSHAKGTFHSYVEKGKELETAKMFRVAPNKFILNITFAWEHAVAITSEEDSGMLVSHRFPQFSFDETIFPLFFGYLILDKKFKNHLELSSPGGAGRNRVLKIKEMLEYKMKFPSKKEQEKIGNFLSSVDKKISITEEKLNLFKDYKKGIMQKIFNQKLKFKDSNGNDYPEWEEKKLGEISSVQTGKKDLEDKKENGIYPFFVRSKNIERIDTYSYDGEAILIPGDGKIGEVYHYINGKFDYHQRVYKISDFKNIYCKYIYYYLHEKFKKHALTYTAKATVDSLRLPVIKEFTIKLPCLEEQEKIADFLSSIDNKIDNLAAELENLKEFKKGLLQQMFV